MPVGLKPIPHAGVLVVGGIVPDQNGSPAAIVASQLFQESKIGRGVEDGILPVMESGAGKFNGTRIFTLLRSPVTGTSGGCPIRLQVACKVESWRKLASSVKISARS